MKHTLRINTVQAQLVADLLGGCSQIGFVGAEEPACDDLLLKLATLGFTPEPWGETTAETAVASPATTVVHHHYHITVSESVDNDATPRRMAFGSPDARMDDWKRGIRG